jgi:protein-disulfide isomerase
LIGTGPDVYMKGRGMLTLLVLAALLATILAGCGGAGSGGSSQASEEEQASRSAGASEQKSEDAGSYGQAPRGRLGHPALGSPDAPVVLTEYSDYQ